MANYILSILKTNMNVVWSWGFSSPTTLPNEKGLMFKVNGFIHKGFVVIEYNEGTDLFDVKLLSCKMEEIKVIDGVFFDILVDVIDMSVERVENYKARVSHEYSLLE